MTFIEKVKTFFFENHQTYTEIIEGTLENNKVQMMFEIVF